MKILLISPYFAPFTGVGGLRMTSLTAYLQKAGEDVTVLKLADTCYDADLANGPHLPGPSYAEFTPSKDGKIPEKTMYPVIDHLCSETAFDCCLVSLGPFFTVKPAVYIKEHYHIPLIVDYRDLWLYDPRERKTLRSILGHKKTQILYCGQEVQLMKACSAFVTCTPRGLQIMERHYPFLKEKSLCIFNGYDMEPPREAEPASQEDGGAIRIFVLGKLSYYTSEGAETLFRAASALSHQGRLIHIYHAGSIENIQPILEKSGLPSEQYHELGPLPYDQAMEAAKAAHICSAIISYTTGLGTKIFDYIYLNKPIIAYAPPGSEFEETLKGAENAYVCQTAPQMEAAIEAIIRDGGYQLTKSLEFRQRFSREAQNQIYHQLLRKTTGQHLEEKEAPN